jgi:hypothetical protein
MQKFILIFFIFLISCQASDNDKFFSYLNEFEVVDFHDKDIVLINLEGCIDCVDLQLNIIDNLTKQDLNDKLFIFTGKVFAEDHDALLDKYSFDFYRDKENRIIKVLPNYTNGIIYSDKTDNLNYVSDERDFINYITNL